MANYVKATNFTAKDSLPSGNAGKIVKGAEIDTELTAIASAISSKADLNSPSLTGTPTASTAPAGTNTTQIATTAFVQASMSGIIVMWSGTIASIPSGWVLCNGSNGTPDLRNRFIIGAHSDSGGLATTTITASNTQTGGSKDAIVISHTHTITDPGHLHNFLTDSGSGAAADTPTNYFLGADGSYSPPTVTSTATTGITINSTGSSGTNANLPPYYALAFIMKT